MNLINTELKDEQKSYYDRTFCHQLKKIRLWTLFWLRKHVQLI